MASKGKRERVTFTATKIVSKPATIKFRTTEGELVSFKGHKDVPKSVRVSFLKKKK
jgi:hypothetical protein